MKNLSLKLITLSALLFWGGCQTAPTVYNPDFTTFEVARLTSNGIEVVEIKPPQKNGWNSQTNTWPEVTFFPAQKPTFAFNSDEADQRNVSPQSTLPANGYPRSASKLGAHLGKSKQPHFNKLKIAVIGDTGCRLKESQDKKSYQNCSDSKEWPYPQIIQAVVKETFDFAIHTGDYHYREHCTDPKLCPGYTKSIGYTWGTWWDDFYSPTQPLFAKAPMLLVRGNHEDCERAFSGWNAVSPLNKKFSDSCTEVEPYQWIDLGDIVFINFDDSAFEDRKPMKPEDQLEHLNVLKEITKRVEALKGKKEIWFLAHKPVYSYLPNKKDPANPNTITPNLQTAMAAAHLLKKVDYILSGHIHNQQLVFDQSDLVQIIVGHSGSALDPFGQKIKNKKLISTTAGKYNFGYALFERQGFKKWSMHFKSQDGATELSCKVNHKKVNCI